MYCFFSSRRRHTRFDCDWSSDVCSSDLPDVFLLGVGGELLQVDFGNDFQNISKLVPAFVENDVLEAVLGGKIDVVLVSLRVHSCFEVDVVDIVEIPPIPSDLAGFDPDDP